MTAPSPAVTVLLCVHNGEATLRAALESVRAQTLRDFELLVVDDASTDGTAALLASFPDPRLRVIRNTANLGLTRSLNVGLRAARGRYVARLDADDTCAPERLARQCAFLDGHPDVGLVGSAASAGDGVRAGPLDETELRWWLLFDNVLVHSSVMFRADLAVGQGYDETYPCAQDYALWSAWAPRTRIVKLPEPLVAISDHPGQISQRRAGEQRACATRVSLVNLSRLLGRPVCEAAREDLLVVHPRPPDRPGPALLRACRLCLELLTAFATSFGVNRVAARRLRRAWALRVLNSLAWEQRGEVLRSGLIGDFLRCIPFTVLWYGWMRLRWKLSGKSLPA